MGSEDNGFYQGTVIYVIGKKNLHNELLTSYLSQEFKVPCVLDTEIERIQRDDNLDEVDKKLVLFDTWGKNLNRLFLEFNSVMKQLFPYIFLTLFNLEADVIQRHEAAELFGYTLDFQNSHWGFLSFVYWSVNGGSCGAGPMPNHVLILPGMLSNPKGRKRIDKMSMPP